MFFTLSLKIGQFPGILKLMTQYTRVGSSERQNVMLGRERKREKQNYVVHLHPILYRQRRWRIRKNEQDESPMTDHSSGLTYGCACG